MMSCPFQVGKTDWNLKIAVQSLLFLKTKSEKYSFCFYLNIININITQKIWSGLMRGKGKASKRDKQDAEHKFYDPTLF